MNFQNKLRSTSAILIFMFLSSLGWAQNNNMKFTKGIRGQSSFELERALSNKSSFIGGFRFYSKNFENNNFKNKGTRLTFEIRRYLINENKAMSGLYVAPNISLGRHNVSYIDKPSSGDGLPIASIGVALASQNSNTSSVPEEEEIVTGESNIVSSGLGVKFGFQKRWDALTFDIGTNISKNSIRGSKTMRLSNGERKNYNEDIYGTDAIVYIGMGYAF